MEPSTAQSYLIRTVNDTEREINRLRHQVSAFETLLTDPSVRGKERIKIRGRRHKAIKRIEAFESQMRRARCALAETESNVLVATHGPMTYMPAFVTYPAPVMCNAEWPTSYTATPSLWANPAAASFQPPQWGHSSAGLNQRTEDVPPMQEAESATESPEAASTPDAGSKTAEENALEANTDLEEREYAWQYERSCHSRCHSAPRRRSVSW
jgi:hypothetical protein